MELNVNANEPRTVGQEVIFKNDSGEEDLDLESFRSHDNADAADADQKTAEGVDAPTNVKSGYLSAKSMFIFFGSLAFVGATGSIAGAAIASSRNTNTKIQSAKMGTAGSVKSPKLPKADIFTCIVGPIIAIGDNCRGSADVVQVEFGRQDTTLTPTTTISRKDFNKDVWKPYMKSCGGFWSDVAYLFTNALMYFYEHMCQLVAFIGDLTNTFVNDFPDECKLFQLPQGVEALLSDDIANDQTARDLIDAARELSSLSLWATQADDKMIDSFLDGAEECARALIDASQVDLCDPAGTGALNTLQCLLKDIIESVLIRRRRRLHARSNRGLASAYKEELFEKLASQEKMSPPTDDQKMKIFRTWEDTPDTTLMWHLVTTDEVEDLKRWIDQHPGAAWLRSEDGRGPMFWAHESNNHEIVAMLKEKGVPDTAMDKYGRTPKDLQEEVAKRSRASASAYKKEHFEKLASQEKMSPPTDVQKMKIFRTWEDTPDTTLMWHLVTTNEVEDLKRWIDQHPGAAWLRSEDGRGPMFWAHESNNHEIVAMLKEKGVPDTAMDKYGRTPKDLQEEKKVFVV